ncbi:MAG: aminoacyl-tRNA hydrolase [Actinobacteria bacterium]|nr:aminoacyl-tRNA hydrolase [Actinomycetota bacterium]
MYLIVGLGNPGPEYANTRHNAGFMVLDKLAEELGAVFPETSCSALWGRGRIDKVQIALAKPITFMNKSGRAVKMLLDHFKLGQESLIVVHDDIDLEPGQVRIRASGGSGGHLGVESVIEDVGGGEFERVKVGVGRPPGKKEAADYVLESFPEGEAEEVALTVARAADAVIYLVKYGVAAAMREYNKK